MDANGVLRGLSTFDGAEEACDTADVTSTDGGFGRSDVAGITAAVFDTVVVGGDGLAGVGVGADAGADSLVVVALIGGGRLATPTAELAATGGGGIAAVVVVELGAAALAIGLIGAATLLNGAIGFAGAFVRAGPVLVEIGVMEGDAPDIGAIGFRRGEGECPVIEALVVSEVV